MTTIQRSLSPALSLHVPLPTAAKDFSVCVGRPVKAKKIESKDTVSMLPFDGLKYRRMITAGRRL